MAYFLTVIGMVLVLEALPYIAFPRKVREWARMIEGVDDRILRLVALVSAFAGLGIIYVGRSMGGV
ncbi:MAG: DUF2065 domain-containing protein [Thermodesulfobacteriota bacterium]|nr:DUF2065 domain-containing protein [Thermodesulfobacteriota bacterium]